MIDIHTHILPNIDDGSNSIETTLNMLKKAEKDGTSHIIATPHYCYNYYTPDINEVKNTLNFVKEEALKNNIKIQVLLGNEVFLDKYTIELFNNKAITTLSDTNYMLIEFPFDYFPDYALDTIYELKILGIKPIVAHPERYEYVIENPSILNQLIKEDCLFQVNAGSIEGKNGKAAQKTSDIILKSGIANFVASDAHSNNTRCTGLSKSMEIVKDTYKETYINILRNMELIIKNEAINQTGEEIKIKKSFSLFSRKK